MNAIQVLLVSAVVIWLVRYLVKLRSPAGTRLVAVVAALGGMLLVVFPELSVELARPFGVTRGVDFVFYVAFVAVGFLWLHHAARIRELEGRLTDLARQVALDRTDPLMNRPEGSTPVRDHPGDDASH